MPNATGGYNDKIPKGYRVGQVQQFDPNQMKLYESMFGDVGPDSYLRKLAGGDEATFNQMEAPAYRDFSALQGNMASRFSGQGLGGRKSSGFQNQMSAAGSNFAQDLQSRRQGLQRQALMDLHGMSNSLLNQRPYERFMYEKPQKEGTNWGGIIGGGVGAVGGFVLGGPMGAVSGAQMGYGAGSAIGGYNSGGGGGGGMNMGGGGGFQGSPGWDFQDQIVNYMPGSIL